ncbi:MAG: RDD family protein [Propionibacteriaceae bacterium]|nr:RDD family protein [Propionibacteriaceae bacterium]
MTNLPLTGGQMPAHLVGVVPVSIGRRILARIVDMVAIMLAQAIPWGVLFAAGFPQAIPVWAFLLALVLMFAVFLAPLILVITTGWMPGAYFVGVRQIKMSTGSRPGASALAKYLVFQVISVATLNIGALVIWFKTRDEMGRCWHDRFADIMVIDTRQGRDPIQEPTPPSAPPRMVPGLIGPGVPAFTGPVGAPQPQGATPYGHGAANLEFVVDARNYEPVPGEAAPVPFGPSPASPWAGQPAPGPQPVLTPQAPHGGPAPAAQAFPEPSWAPEAGFGPPQSPASYHSAAQAAPSGVLAGLGDHGGEQAGEDATISKIPPGSVKLTFDDGTVHHVRTSVVLGRDPVPDAEHPGAQRIPVRDPDRTISKTHAVLTVHGDSVVVEDLNSTNGTVVVAPNGERSSALPGTPIWAGAGSTVEFGERSVRIGG